MSSADEHRKRTRHARNVRKDILANKRRRSTIDISLSSSEARIPPTGTSNYQRQHAKEARDARKSIMHRRRHSKKNDTSMLTNDYQEMDHHSFQTILEEYVDFGDPSSMCLQCGAMMWYEERVNKRIKNKPPTFSLCCSNGKVQLPKLKDPPELLRKLLFDGDSRSRNFIKNIRSYNMMFSFTSMGGRIDDSINKGKAPYVFKIQGSNYHRIGSLLPDPNSAPKFAQLYIYDTSNEVQNRIDAIGSRGRSNSNKLDPEIVNDLKNMLDEFNTLAKSFRMARERIESDTDQPWVMRLIEKRDTDGRTYNLPTTLEVAALIPGDIDVEFEERDIILQERDGTLQRISELHPSYLGLQYPLLFPYGEDGYRLGILHKDASSTSRQRVKLTMREFFAYRIQERLCDSRLIFHCRKLYQQFLVDAYTMIESERLSYIRTHQVQLRTDSQKNIKDAVQRGQIEPSSTGKRIIPKSYTGGRRYMIQNYQDAMAICKWYSYPDLFITFTCNPKWPEIIRFLENRGLKAEDRPDILCRLFKMKLDNLIRDFKDNELFGKTQAIVYTIEFQKRGLPHAHILLFLNRQNKIPSPEDVDRIIFAEIPDVDIDMKLHELVKDLMMHGPCGVQNKNSPCMVKGKCSKNFPKSYVEKTTVDDEGYPLYKRRDNGRTLKKNEKEMDNRFVVPYNPTLLKRYQAHINVEWCNQLKSIKYLFKYINKGHDRVTAEVYQRRENDANTTGDDEIKNHINCRYISPCEAVWRTLSYEIHYQNPSVQRLSFHLPGEQNIIFEDEDTIDSVLDKPNAQKSMFMAWFKANQEYVWARDLTYLEFPTKFVWKSKEREWIPRQQRLSLGRLYYVPPGSGEMYYLGILIHHIKGARCHEELRTIHGVVYPTFKDACYALGLLDDDREYIDGIKEANFWASAHYLRNLFAILLMSNSMSSPEVVFDKTLQYLSDDILHMHRRMMNIKDLQLCDEQIKNYTLIEIEKILHQNGSTLKRFTSMPYPDRDIADARLNKLIHEELQYNRSDLKAEHDTLFSTLTYEQKKVYEEIIEAVVTDKGGIFFLYGFGGTGKTFVWKTLSAYIRSQGHIVLNVASSGIASLLLPGGRTAHSRFAIPLDVNEDSTCQIKPGTELAELIAKTKLIIWDEAPMMNRYCFESLDKSLRDIIRDSSNRPTCEPFGGKTIVFGGDFRQILPVIPKGSREDIVYATINSSYLWKSCKVLRLTRNMRLKSRSSTCDEEGQQLREFSDWILKVGDGEVGDYNDGYSKIEIPQQNLIMDVRNDPIEAIVNALYPSISTDFNNQSYFEDRAILAPTHKVVEAINEHVLSKIPGQEKVYLSSDSLCKASGQSVDIGEVFSVDILNSIKCSGIPNHRLILKIGVPIMLLRNIDQKAGLCNGTRLIVTKLGNHVLEAQIISGRNIGNKAYIPRMVLSPSDPTTPVKFQRRQFPVLLCFAMTINKSQGQSLSNVGLFLPKPVFTHGQLYVAFSRVKSPDGLKVLCLGDDEKPSSTTINVVFKEVFQNLN